MPTSHCIILAGLDAQSQSVVESCVPNHQCKLTEVDLELVNEPPEQVDLVVFAATDDLLQTQDLCAAMRSRFGRNVPLLACVGRYVYPTIRPLIGTDLQAVIMTPFDANELRSELDQLELRF